MLPNWFVICKMRLKLVPTVREKIVSHLIQCPAHLSDYTCWQSTEEWSLKSLPSLAFKNTDRKGRDREYNLWNPVHSARKRLLTVGQFACKEVWVIFVLGKFHSYYLSCDPSFSWNCHSLPGQRHVFTGRAGSCQGPFSLFPSWPSPWLKLNSRDAGAAETASLMLQTSRHQADMGWL